MAVFGGPEIVNSGLVLHLDAINEKSYPGSGNTWFDLSGNSNNVSMSQGFNKLNRSISFNGTSQYAAMVSSFWNHDSGNPFTISIWIKSTDSGSIFVQSNNSSPLSETKSVEVFGITAQGLARFEPFWTGSSNNAVFSTIAINDGEWHNLVGVFKNGLASLFVNGELNSNKTGLTAISYNNNYYYRLAGNGIENIQIEIANLQFYNVELSRSMIRKNFEAYRSRYGLQTETIQLNSLLNGGTSETVNRNPIPSASSNSETVTTILDGGTA